MENSNKNINIFRSGGQNKKTTIFIVLIIIAFFGGIFIGNTVLQPGQSVVKGADPDKVVSSDNTPAGEVENKDQIPEYLTKDVDFNLFWDVWNLVKTKYYEKGIPETQLFYGALSGLVSSIDDPYSVFLTPQNTDNFEDEIEGHFEGIGAEIGIKNNRLTVISPLPDSPAIVAGLRSGDIITLIDDYDTNGIKLFDAVDRIRGPKGSQVTLTIYRDGETELREIVITRDTINVKSVSWEMLDSNIFYIEVRQFNDDTMLLFNDAIMELSQGDTQGIILDLRNNPGGYLQSAIDMSAEWVNSKVVVSEKLRDGSVREHKTGKEARLENYPTVVLVNEGSASGSEIVAGALKDWEEATIIGMTTFGKGSVQDLTYLKDGSSIKLTVAKWFTPNGVSIEDEGVTPDIEVDLTEEDYNSDLDPQLDEAIKAFN